MGQRRTLLERASGMHSERPAMSDTTPVDRATVPLSAPPLRQLVPGQPGPSAIYPRQPAKATGRATVPLLRTSQRARGRQRYLPATRPLCVRLSLRDRIRTRAVSPGKQPDCPPGWRKMRRTCVWFRGHARRSAEGSDRRLAGTTRGTAAGHPDYRPRGARWVRAESAALRTVTPRVATLQVRPVNQKLSWLPLPLAGVPVMS